MTPSRPTAAVPRTRSAARVAARSSARSSSPAGPLFAARERPERPSFGRSPDPGRPAGPAAGEAARAARTGIPAPVLAAMERHFGEDFSAVRVKPESATASHLSALAYTQGHELHFAPGRFQPDTRAGRALLGHELAHVRQQRAGRVAPTVRLASGVELNDSPELEREAEREGTAVAASFAAGAPAPGGDGPPEPGGGDGAGDSGAAGPPSGRGGGPPRSPGGGPIQRSAEEGEIPRQGLQDFAGMALLLLAAQAAINRAAAPAAAPGAPGGGGPPPGPPPPPAPPAAGGGRKRREREVEPDDARGGSRQRIAAPPLQLKATATGYGGGSMDSTVLPALAHPGVAGPALGFGAIRAVSNTSTGVQTTDLHRQPLGTGVGGKRPNNWIQFVAMANAPGRFVQGHSLSQRLGGKGLHNNLSPFTRSLNALHYYRAERHVIKQTAAGKGKYDQYADYDVDVSYKGNAKIGAWGVGKFNAMPLNNRLAAMVGAGVITPKQAAGYKAAGAIPGVKKAAAHAFITTYVNNTFPSHIDCTAIFVDENPVGVFQKTPPQAVKITNDL